MAVITQSQLEEAVRKYYTRYYRDELGIPSWLNLVESRLNEETTHAGRLVGWLECWLNSYSYVEKRILVVGGGTGAETLAFMSKGANVVTIEPSNEATRIIDAKVKLQYGPSSSVAAQAVGEALPYIDNAFGLVVCHTVLEHTQNPVDCIAEMIRVTRPRGWIYIGTPDYRHLYEPHYKIYFPLVAPRFLLRFFLRLKRRPTAFLDSLQFLNAKLLAGIFQNCPVTAFQVLHSWPQSWKVNPTTQMRLVKWVTQTFNIQRDQYWLLQKLEKPR